jgi:hypothetical protein
MQTPFHPENDSTPAQPPHGTSICWHKRQLLLNLSTLVCAASVSGWRVASAQALSLADLSQKDAGAGVRAALEKGADVAVQLLGKQDGFWGNDRVRIPLPEWIGKAERGLKLIGKGGDVDALKLGINRAAEQAVPQAKKLLSDAVKSMSVQDAKLILTGGENSVTQFFREKTSVALTQKFLPIVTSVTERSGLAKQYNALAAQIEQSGLVRLKPEQRRVETHVTNRALDGLFFMIGEQEKKIRQDPVGTGSDILRRVFGSLRG